MSGREHRGALPVVGSSVELVLDRTGRAWRTRVEDVAPAAVLVIAPAFEVVASGGVPRGSGPP